VCITRDPGLRRTLRRSLQAVGTTVEFRDGAQPGEDATPADPQLVVIDHEARKAMTTAQILELMGDSSGLIVLGESLEDDDVVALLRNHPLDHVIGDGRSPDETELVVTSVKLLSGDIFGLEKYLSWGVKIHELEVHSYEEKRLALISIADYARQVGARRQAIAKIESVADELLMNAMYDAPAVSRGEPPHVPVGPLARPGEPADRALLRWACDGRYFAVSVDDRYGQLHKEAILDNLMRARAERGRPRPEINGVGGAGLGVYFILSSVTRFIANVDPGRRTEVVCMFDLRQTGREAEACARSLHVFTLEGTAQLEEPTRPG
jgi:hypothetical protein